MAESMACSILKETICCEKAFIENARNNSTIIRVCTFNCFRKMMYDSYDNYRKNKKV